MQKSGGRLPKVGDWTCPCKFYNYFYRKFCMICKKPKPGKKGSQRDDRRFVEVQIKTQHRCYSYVSHPVKMAYGWNFGLRFYLPHIYLLISAQTSRSLGDIIFGTSPFSEINYHRISLSLNYLKVTISFYSFYFILLCFFRPLFYASTIRPQLIVTRTPHWDTPHIDPLIE